MTSGECPRKSEGLPDERRKVRKDFLDKCKQLLDECGKVPEELLEITMGFRPDTEMCNGYSGQVLSRSKRRKGCKDKVQSRIGPEDRGKVPEELPETWRNGGLDERRSGGTEEWRSKGSEEWGSGGAKVRRSRGAEEQSSGLGNSSLGLRWIFTKSED
ncbi:hypothetical protein C8R48DRAFT_778090 [Suillus tomentosus]|nr:hypothetical protein C8R48DRAFT_778090 [Suillus tomentosus]